MTAAWSGVTITLHFEEQAIRRRINRSAILARVADAAPRLLAYEGCRLAVAAWASRWCSSSSATSSS